MASTVEQKASTDSPSRMGTRLRLALDRRGIKIRPGGMVTLVPGHVPHTVAKDVSSWLFMALDRVGVHLMPKHYSTPVADYAWLRRDPDAWQLPASLVGVEWDVDAQLRWLRETYGPYAHEVQGSAWYDELVATGVGQGLTLIEAQMLHGVMRAVQPSKVIEVGSGLSTAIMRRASALTAQAGGPQTQIVAIDPYPRAALRHLPGITHIEELAQRVPRTVFDQLEPGDLLFIDSSHTVKIGSEVTQLFLEIIPALKPGVYIQIHDIFLPYLYTRTAGSDYLDWQETTLALALLTHNAHLSVLCCQSALHYDRPAELAAILPDYRPQSNRRGLQAGDIKNKDFPRSLWLRTV